MCATRWRVDGGRVCGVLVTGLLSVGAYAGCGGTPAQQVEAAAKPAKSKPPKPKPEPEDTPPESPPKPPLPKTPSSLEAAITAAGLLYAEQRTTLFCGCRFSDTGRVSPASCGYRTRADEDLAKQVEWGHVVVPSEFGAHRECWSQAKCAAPDGTEFRGIECCQQMDEEFAAMRTDLHNLVPLVGEVATDRSNYAFGEVDEEPRLYGSCDLEIDSEAGRVEPPPQVRGDIARTYMYMAQTYPDALRIDAEQMTLLQTWAAEDPPDDAERARAEAITKIQGIAPRWLSEAPAAPAVAVVAAEGGREAGAGEADAAGPGAGEAPAADGGAVDEGAAQSASKDVPATQAAPSKGSPVNGDAAAGTAPANAAPAG